MVNFVEHSCRVFECGGCLREKAEKLGLKVSTVQLIWSLKAWNRYQRTLLRGPRVWL
jgi:hypothetical protein